MVGGDNATSGRKQNNEATRKCKKFPLFPTCVMASTQHRQKTLWSCRHNLEAVFFFGRITRVLVGREGSGGGGITRRPGEDKTMKQHENVEISSIIDLRYGSSRYAGGERGWGVQGDKARYAQDNKKTAS